MPIPFILAGLALAAGGYGVKKGLDAKEDMDAAESYNEEATAIAKKAENKIENAKVRTRGGIEKLGRRKIEIMSTTINSFVDVFSKIKNINFNEGEGLEELKNFNPQSEEFGQLKEASMKAVDLAAGGLGAIAGGSLLAAGTYGAVMCGGFAAASTGAGIAGLSGVAATNATLAWLGGGALSAGGFGMAGGMAVLGGLVAGPALALGGAFLASKAEEAKYTAMSNLDKAKEFSEQAKNIASMLEAMRKRADQLDELLSELNYYFRDSIRELKYVVQVSGNNWNDYTMYQKVMVGKSAQLAKTIKIVLDTSLLKEDGTLNQKCKEVIDMGNTKLGELGQAG